MNNFLRKLASAQRGERSAIEDLIAEFAADVRQVCLGISLAATNDLSVSDLNQEAWCKIWLQLDRFLVHGDSTDPRQQFKVWLRQTARNEILHVLEKRQAKKRRPQQEIQHACHIDVPDKDASPSSKLGRAEELHKLMQAIDKLDRLSRAAIVACFLEGRTVSAMADQLGLTYSEGRTQLSKAMDELRKHFVDPFP